MRFREIADARNAVISIQRVAPNLASQALWNDVVSGHARVMVGIVPPWWLEFSFVS